MYKVTTETGAIIEECTMAYEVCSILKNGLANKRWDMHRFHVSKYDSFSPYKLIYEETAAWFLTKHVLELQERVQGMSESLMALGSDIIQIHKILLKHNLITQEELLFPRGDKAAIAGL